VKRLKKIKKKKPNTLFINRLKGKTAFRIVFFLCCATVYLGIKLQAYISIPIVKKSDFFL